ncbi:MAG TPA: ABC transporter substrate-binding protein [Microlunatus sp.]
MRTPRPIRFLTALAGLPLVLGTGCSAPEETGPGAEAGATWSFTDDLAKTVTLDARPTRVAGLSDVVYSLMNYGLKPVASFGYSDLAADTRFTDLDTSGIVELGKTYGEIDIEALAKAAPDVIVTHVYPTDASGTIDQTQPLYGFKDLAQQEQVAGIAPIVTIVMGGSAADVIQRTTELVVALGASADSGPVAEGEVAFDQASAALTAAAKSGVVSQPIYAEAANVYVAKAPDDPGLRMYADLGMKFVEPKTEDYYWDIISWEDYDTIGGDLVLYSQRGFGPEQLQKQPTFAATPAAKANQIHPWVFAGMDYPSQAAYMTQLAGWLTDATKVS